MAGVVLLVEQWFLEPHEAPKDPLCGFQQSFCNRFYLNKCWWCLLRRRNIYSV